MFAKEICPPPCLSIANLVNILYMSFLQTKWRIELQLIYIMKLHLALIFTSVQNFPCHVLLTIMKINHRYLY
jgi:hypothetical protein